jgi:UMF1 family MFS transporter
MAVDYGMALGFATESLITALLITQFVGFPAALAFGAIGSRWGTKQGILLGLAIYSGVAIWGFFMQREWEFYVLAIAIGLVQGGVQSLSRSLYSRLIPAQQAAEFFGFYNMWGKYADIIGPVLMGWVGLLTGNPRFGVLALVILLVSGGLLLTQVREAEPQELSEERHQGA